MKISRRRTVLLAAVAVLAVLVLGPYVLSRLRSPGRRVRVRSDPAATAAEEPATIRVLAFNIAHGRGPTDHNWERPAGEKPKRIEDIARLVADSGADVVVLNEVDFSATWSDHQNQAEAIARAAGFPYWVEQRNLDFRFLYGSWKFGNAVLSKYPIADARLVEFPPHRAWESWLAGHQRGVVCTLQLSPSRQVRLLAVHLEHRDRPTRVASAEAIAELAAAGDVPLIVAGDFNAASGESPGAGQPAADGDAIDVLTASDRFQIRPQAAPGVDEMTYPSTSPGQVIDWIMIPRAWRFVDYRTIESQLSDHRPVVATVEWDEAAADMFSRVIRRSAHTRPFARIQTSER